jgi:hypothetical protein
MNLGLGMSIYSPAQLEEFARFQESQGTWRAFLAESAEKAYDGKVGREWGSGLTDLATENLICAVRDHLVLMFRVIGPTAAVVLLILFLMGILRMTLDIVMRPIAIARVRGCGWWLMGAFGAPCFRIQWHRCSGRWPRGTSSARCHVPDGSQGCTP